MSDIPEEILPEILSRLPVLPLLRFRCVSKSWKGLIDSPQFINHHLNQSQKSHSNLNIIIRRSYLYSADFDALNETNWATFEELSHPLKTPDCGTEILGSCNGLLALSNGEEDNILWNPSTRRFQKLPVTEIEFPVYFTACQYIIYGFGYDSVSDDYKLVRIIQFYGDDNDSFDSEVKVCSLKSHSWRRIPDFPYYLKYKRAYGVLANGALHWVVSRKVESDTVSLVAAFDLATEEYRLVPLPDYADCDFHMNVVELGGCLGVMCNYYKDHVDIWVMKEYGVKESWTVLLTLRQCDVYFKRFEFVSPITYAKSGRKLLLALDDRVLLWYDLDEKSIDFVMVSFPFEPDSFELNTCLQSLVVLNGGTWHIYDVAQKSEEMKRKKRGSRKMRDDFLSTGFKLVL